jgi:hypothetical protein
MKVDSIADQLLEMISQGESASHKSSHWQRHTEKFAIKNNKVLGIDGFSPRSRKFPFSNLLHEILQKRNFNNLSIPTNSSWYFLGKVAAKKQCRSFDLDILRQVFTLDFLEGNLNLNSTPNICIIGDGQANFTSIALQSSFFNKIISVNLPEVLLSDWELIKKLSFQGITAIARSENDCQEFFKSDNRFAMIQASDCNILSAKPIDLFVNIASFGEMRKDTIAKYFKIIKSSTMGAALYCCNRREKRLTGGELLRFSEYPWNGFARILADEPCPWHQSFYSLKRNKFLPIPKAGIAYDGIFDHRLIVYPASGDSKAL